jgi:hypothetical protein
MHTDPKIEILSVRTHSAWKGQGYQSPTQSSQWVGCPRNLANIEIVNDQACVHHHVWRDGVESPHMDPGISCPECEK